MKKTIATLAVAMLCCGLAGPAAAATYSLTYSDGPLDILEGDYTYADIADSHQGTITDVNVFVNINHTWVGDLDVYLAHSVDDGATWKYVQLLDEDGGSANNLRNILFDDSAPAYINEVSPPWADATFKPTNGFDGDADSSELAYFIGDQALGIWSLVLYDNATGDTGTLENYRVDVQTAVPLPGAVVLLGSGLVALVGVRRRSGRK
jgi:subtilisin-like proprotein convertase family protein